MPARYIVFLTSCLFLFIFEVYHEYYLTALVQSCGLSLLFFRSVRLHNGRLSRELLLYFYFISYPIQIAILLLQIPTKSPASNWSNNDFIFDDFHTVVVVFISIVFYWFLIELHNGLTVFSVQFFRSEHKLSADRKGYFNTLMNSSFYNKTAPSVPLTIKNGRMVFWVAIVLLLAVIFIQNNNGWGVHGLPHYVPNIYKMAGASVYLRDYLIPVFIAYGLWRGFKVSPLTKVMLFFLVFITSATSLSKVTLIVYALLYIYAVSCNDNSQINNKLAKTTSLLMLLLISMWVTGIYVALALGRVLLVNEGGAVHQQLFMLTGFIFELGIAYWEVVDFSLFMSLIDRFLGFKELASVIYYQGSMDYYVNLLHYIFAIDQTTNPQYTSVRDLTGSTIGGGVGLDIVGGASMTGWLLPFPSAIIAMNIFFQRLFLESIPVTMKVMAESMMMVMLLRIFIDGNFIMMQWFTFIIGLIFLAGRSKSYLIYRS
jgi:hypothetical protein